MDELDERTARGKGSGARERGVEDRETAVTTCEDAVALREQLAVVRERALAAQEDARNARAARDAIVGQMREANEMLVLATMRSAELCDESERLREAAHAAQMASAASEQRFRLIVTTSAAVVFVADAAGRASVDAATWRAVTGMEISGGMRLGDALHPADRQGAREAWALAVANGARYEREYRLRRPDGSYASVASRAEPILEGDRAREWIGTITDVSDRVRIEEAREQFIAILGHDLRGPLGAISMGAEVLTRAELAGVEGKVVHQIARGARRMDRMVRSLLDFARGRLGGGIPISRTRCDLGSVCEEAVAEARQGHPDRTITCVEHGDTLGDWDTDRLEQVLSNLLANALQHGTDPIAVTVEGRARSILVTIHNHGPAIPEATLPVLFEPFLGRAPGTTKGLGLGLYIVREVVRAHGGTISVTSSTDGGTMFGVELPRFESIARAASA